MTESERRSIAWEATEKLCDKMELESSLDDFFRILAAKLPLRELMLGRQDPDGQKLFILSRTNRLGTVRMLREYQYSPEKMRIIRQKKFFETERVENILVSSPDHFLTRLTDFEGDAFTPFYATRNVYHGRLSGGGRFSFHRDAKVTPPMLRLLDMVSTPLKVFTNAWLQYWEMETLKNRLVRENRTVRHKLAGMDSVNLVGAEAGLRPVVLRLRQVSPLNVSTLVLGETGTGKELVARAIHEMSPRRSKPFVAVNCGAIPLSIIDSQLFGHMRGSFTGALQDHKGVFEQAEGGTLFLDEIGELPLEVQARLLRVLEQRQIVRVGGKSPLAVDFRLVTATNRNLEGMVAKGAFREDLYYRLKVVTVEVPPLRERKQDIPLLLAHFLEKAALQFGMAEPSMPDAEVRRLLAHDWPGNVREFQNVVQEAVAFSSYGRIVFWPKPMEIADGAKTQVDMEHLSESRKEQAEDIPSLTTHENTECAGLVGADGDGLPAYDTLMEHYLSRGLHLADGKIRGPGGLAELTGIHYSTLRAKLKKYHVAHGRRAAR